jgi:esterase
VSALHHVVVAPAGGEPATRHAWFLHGILGSGGNLRTLAKLALAERKGWGAVLVDLRGHGRSALPPGPHTIAACAADVAETARASGVAVDAFVAHSFGGKVALAAFDACAPAYAFILDSSPVARPDARGSEGTVRVVTALREVGKTFATRDELSTKLAAAGVDASLHAWLGMNLERDGERFRMRLDVDAIDEMLADYFATDWTSALEADAAPRTRFVLGGASTVVDAEARARIDAIALATRDRLDVRVLPGVGHWVHAEAAEGCAKLIAELLPG